MHRCCVLYTMLRPPERRFRRELGMLYDFTPLLMPQVHLAETREQFGPFFARDAVLCDKLIAISKSTKVDASWLCDVGGDDVAVGYPGPSVCVQEHAHRRLGFAAETVAQWMTAAGLDMALQETLAPEPGSEGKIAVSLWLARDPRIAFAGPAREVA